MDGWMDVTSDFLIRNGLGLFSILLQLQTSRPERIYVSTSLNLFHKIRLLTIVFIYDLLFSFYASLDFF